MNKFGIVFILLIIGSFTYLMVMPYDPYYCEKEKRALTEKEIPVPMYDIIRGIAETHGFSKKTIKVIDENSSETTYDEKDMRDITNKVKKYFQNHPENITKSHYKETFLDRSEAYSVNLYYFYSPDEIIKVNNYVQKNWRYKSEKKIVGISYWQSYSACGDSSFGMQDEIFENDVVDQKYNPYRKNE